MARVLGGQKPRQVFLKKSLGTKDRKEASVRAKITQVGFDQVLRRASDLTAPRNVQPNKRQSLNSAEIVRMAEAFFSQLLAEGGGSVEELLSSALSSGSGATTSPTSCFLIGCAALWRGDHLRRERRKNKRRNTCEYRVIRPGQRARGIASVAPV